jgi:Raf kinase inhibitor-like YbhB/YbcL family protein
MRPLPIAGLGPALVAGSALVVGLAVGLAGCSSGSPAASPTTPATTPPAATSSASSAPATSSADVPATLTVTSTAFAEGGTIPATYTCAGAGQMPAIAWSGDLRGATAIAVIVDDPDAPIGTFVHLIVLDLPASATGLGATLPAGAHYALNGAGRPGWTPPCPPSGTHHYHFTVYGLSAPTGLGDGATAVAARAAINAKAVVQGRLTGLVSH